MRSKLRSYCFILLASGVLVVGLATWKAWLPLAVAKRVTARSEQATRAWLTQAYNHLPLSFEANQGQTESQADFLSRGNGYSLFLSSTEAVLALKKMTRRDGESSDVKPEMQHQQATLLRMKLVGANPSSRAMAVEELPGKINYFIGNDPTQWHTNIPSYAKVKYEGIYPGVDLIYYGNRGRLEYDFIIEPETDPKCIVLDFEGATDLQVDLTGDLILRAGDVDFRQTKPRIYQVIDGEEHDVSGGYTLHGKHQVGFQVGQHDIAKPLIIDPVLTYSSFLGGSGGESGFGIAVDSSGSAYVAGVTGSANFPATSGAVQRSFGGSGTSTALVRGDASVTKLNADGSAVLYSTYLGGNADDGAFSIAVDAAGNAYVTGEARSSNFPVTAGALQTAFSTGGQCSSGPCTDVFVTKLNSTGSALIYSTYLGGRQVDEGHDIAVDSLGNAYVTGQTESSDFPTTSGAFQRTHGVIPSPSQSGDVFVSKLNASGSALIYSTYLGAGGDDIAWGIATDSAGNAYVTGMTSSTDFPVTAGTFQSTKGGRDDAFITKVNPSGSALVYSTYLGGADNELGWGIALDAAGNAYVAGGSRSSNFPTTGGALQRAYAGPDAGSCDLFVCGDAFVTKLNSAGSALVYSTYLGGSGADFGTRIRVYGSGEIYLTGVTASRNFPTANPIQATNTSVPLCGDGDVFLARLNAAGSGLLFSSYLGGVGDDFGFGIAVDAAGNAYLAGFTRADPPPAGPERECPGPSNNFPTKSAFQGAYAGARDAFVAKIALDDISLPAPTAFTITNRGGASFTTTGGSGSTVVGYARIQPSTGNTVPSGMAIFGFRQGGVLVTEAAVPASPLLQSGRIYAEVAGPVNTGLAIANPNNQTATITFNFTDAAGQNFGSGTTTIAANGQLAAFLDQSPFNGGSSVLGTFSFSSNVPVSVVALRGFANERSEFLITTLPVVDLSAAVPTGESIIFPHFADGGGWSTQVVLVNRTDSALTGTVQFVTSSGAAATLNVDGQSGNTFSYSIPARSARRLQSSGSAGATQSGSIRITPAANNRTPSGLAIFTFRAGGFTVSEGGVPALRTGMAFRLYVEASGNFNASQVGSVQTGFAIANPSSTPAAVTFDLTRLDGSSTGLTGSTSVPGNGQIALFVNQISGFSALGNPQTPFQGVLRISSTSSAIAVVGLRGRYNERGDFLITTTAPADESSVASTTELFFPHLADAGGYTTQFILFSGSAGQSSAGTLRLFSQSGQPLSLSVR